MKILKPTKRRPSFLPKSLFSNFRKLKISKQIIITFFVMICFLVILLLVNILSFSQISNANQRLINAFSDRALITNLKNISNKRSMQIDSIRRLAQNNVELGLKDYGQIELIPTEIENTVESLQPVIDNLVPEKQEELNKLVAEIATNCNDWINEKKVAHLYYASSTLRRFEYFVNELAVTLNEIIDANVKTAEDQIKNVQLFNIILNIFAFSLLIIIIVPLIKHMRKLFSPVHQAADNALQGAVNALEYAAQINESISELKSVLIEISSSISDVTVGAQDSSNQAEKIISSIQITSDLVAELAEIANTVYKNLDANQTNIQDKITQVKNLSENISQSLEMINKNADIASQLTFQVNNLEQQMDGINSFLIAMGEITEQTNLLALNASIEAARAEEHGKGFAVVAERIRNLSNETKNFTTQIRDTVTGIQSVANEVASALNNIISAVRSSASEVSDVNQEFSNLKNVLESLYSSNAAILKAADLQLDGTKQIHTRALDMTKAVENITAQTEQVSASMEELAASSQEINAQVELIHTKVTETKEVVQHQLEMARMTKETTDYI